MEIKRSVVAQKYEDYFGLLIQRKESEIKEEVKKIDNKHLTTLGLTQESVEEMPIVNLSYLLYMFYSEADRIKDINSDSVFTQVVESKQISKEKRNYLIKAFSTIKELMQNNTIKSVMEVISSKEEYLNLSKTLDFETLIETEKALDKLLYNEMTLAASQRVKA